MAYGLARFRNPELGVLRRFKLRVEKLCLPVVVFV